MCTQHTKCVYVEGTLLVRNSEFVCTKTTLTIYMKSGIALYTVKLFIVDCDSYRVTIRSRSSSVCVAIGWTFRGSNPGTGYRLCSPLKRPDRIWGLPSLLLNGNQVSFLQRIKRPGREVKHLPRYSAEVRNEWDSACPTCLNVVIRENFTFRLLSAFYALVYVKLNCDMTSFLKRNVSFKMCWLVSFRSKCCDGLNVSRDTRKQNL